MRDRQHDRPLEYFGLAPFPWRGLLGGVGERQGALFDSSGVYPDHATEARHQLGVLSTARSAEWSPPRAKHVGVTSTGFLFSGPERAAGSLQLATASGS